MQLDINKLNALESLIKEMGAYAIEKQTTITPTLKKDNSVLTETDLYIDRTVTAFLQSEFPEANIITEEFPSIFNMDAPYTFVLDPIDGTDVYSQGFPSFAIALGILDKSWKPVGSMIYAPRFGKGKYDLFVRLDPEGKLFVDGEEFCVTMQKDEVHQITMGSKGQHDMDFSSYRGKVRIFGSSIIHLLGPVIYSDIQACVNQPCFIWDVASAHAILLACNMDIEFVDGTPFVYDEDFVINRKAFKMPFYAGSKKAIADIRVKLPYKY